jgi:flavin-binding protein dodecin
MEPDAQPKNDPVALVAKSRRNMVDAVRQALSGAARTLGGLERCEALMRPQVVSDARGEHFEVLLSVSRRHNTVEHPG